VPDVLDDHRVLGLVDPAPRSLRAASGNTELGGQGDVDHVRML
jgi:hypothetical protein